MKITALKHAGFAFAIGGLAAAAHVLVGASPVTGQTTTAMNDALSSAPLDVSNRGLAVLAPQASALKNHPISDRTPVINLHQDIEAPSNIVLPAQPSQIGSEDDAATVLADSLVLQGDNSLIAAGGVVVWYRGARLVASRLTVDGGSGALTIEGPVHLSQPQDDSGEVLIADSAMLDRDLQDGIIRGVRLLMDHKLQLAANQATRSGDGRYTQLSKVAASACRVCAGGGAPLWEIRARGITHDAKKRVLTFDRPQLRAFGLPLAYAPFTVVAPDPSVARLSGFLRPSFRTTSNLGFGVKVPYFQTLGDHADLTVTPYVSVSRTRTLELRYRQAFRRGAVEWNGAITRDDIKPGQSRGYLFGSGVFMLPRDYVMGIQLQMASDRAYLLDYGVSEADRLWSGVTLERVRRDKLVFARVGNYHSLRRDDEDQTSPAQVADAYWIRRITPPRLPGGEAWLEWTAHAHLRPSTEDIIGRDVARASLGLDWRRSQILPGGVVGSALLGLDMDLYRIVQDSRYDDVVTRADPMAGFELRWPLIGYSGGATHLVEPALNLLWSPQSEDDDIPNEDSRLIEFDEGNLLAASRFPGADARETGLRANFGLRWTRMDPAGWSIGMTVGRVFRSRSENQFANGSPLDGKRSDWLLSANYDNGRGIALANRALIDDSLQVSRNEFRLGWSSPGVQVSVGHLWINSDLTEERLTDANEFTADIGWQIAPGWWANAETRYDFANDKPQKTALDVTYRNECVNVEFGVSRRFTDSVSVREDTRFDLSVRLGGFGRDSDASGTVAQRSCMR